jgi:hypothetical protein
MIFKRRRDRKLFEVPVETEPGVVPESSLYDLLKQEIDKIVTLFEDAKADSDVTLSEVWNLVTEVISSLVKVAEEFGGDGDNKKAAVLAALELFYDEVIAPLDIPYVPNIVEPVVDRAAKRIFLQIADGVIDAIVSLLNREKVFQKNE